MVTRQAAPDPRAFLGSGWSFPVGVRPDGSVATATYEEDVHQAIRIVLGTNPGERAMRPDFGAGLDRFVFEPVSPTTMTRVRTRVHDALVDWEPRIDILDVVVTCADPEQRNRLDIEVQYRVRATNGVHNLVYPFYLEEGTPQ
ncbi:GPW/gp25 family protein [Wenjunlia tyrosinilytica]|jgi:phage baseplate assembly protein W|uniref:Baseplate protein n=1 Tax=Wenjunlia tyrosinilytica TaxID=1544741 RepID=A0A918E0W9_9ACTN|nr:GPW/gp25 family protein [Wenjunlia tyrosinilytica]GGO94455.1 baseplate protein [Wenjunlia tyrosinilytica]